MKFFLCYKYVLSEDIVFQTDIHPREDVVTELIELTVSGLLTVKKWYPWDGASGPMPDTLSNYEASCAHDALYELIRKGKLPRGFWELADVEYLRLLEKNNEWKLLIKINALGLKTAKGYYSNPKRRKKVYDTKAFS